MKIFKNLIVKELYLCAHPTYYIYILLGVLVIIPSYPYSSILLFGCLSPLISLYNARENNDFIFSMTLPLAKKDIVKAKIAFIVIGQIGQLLVSLPFSYLRYIMNINNSVGIEANVAFYGFALIIYGIFNLILIPNYFKNPDKLGKAFLLALIPTTILMIIMESVNYIDKFKFMDGVNVDDLIMQLPIIGIGILFYLVVIVISYKISEKRFKVVTI